MKSYSPSSRLTSEEPEMTAMNVKGNDNKTMESACTSLKIKLGGELKRDEWRGKRKLGGESAGWRCCRTEREECRLTS